MPIPIQTGVWTSACTSIIAQRYKPVVDVRRHKKLIAPFSAIAEAAGQDHWVTSRAACPIPAALGCRCTSQTEMFSGNPGSAAASLRTAALGHTISRCLGPHFVFPGAE